MAKRKAAERTDGDWIPGEVVSPEDQESGMPEVRIVPTDDLVNDAGVPIFSDPDNANEHDDPEIARLTSSFAEHGVLEAVCLNRETRQLIGGHGRIQAAFRARQPRMILLVVSRDYVQQRAANIALNAGAYGHMNTEMLQRQLRELTAALDHSQQSLEGLEALTGFDAARLAALVPELSQPGPPPTAPGEFPSFDENIDTQYCCPSCGYAWSGNPKPASGDAAAADA